MTSLNDRPVTQAPARTGGALGRNVKRAIVGTGKILLLPLLLAFRLRLLDYPTVGHLLSLVPGRLGVGLRRGWYEMTLEQCGSGLVVEFLAAFRTPRARVGDNCFIGIGSWIGWAHLGDDVMTGNHITILSGRHQHGFTRLDVAMHVQAGQPELVRIGSDVWIGAGAVIACDVSPGTIIGAGAVVTRTFPEYAILAGVPGAQIGSRNAVRS
jgi:acetyltransferase-like isoleucine patch superfamily enzyme